MPSENRRGHLNRYDNIVSTNPYQVLSSKVVYRNPWITVKEDAVHRPYGQPGIFGSVYIGAGASILAIDRERMCYLVREWKYPLDEFSLEVISGGQDGEEPIEECARRELAEEAGLTGGQLIQLGIMESITSIVKAPVHLFLALDVDQGIASPADDEFLEVVRMPFAEAYQMAMSGRLQHAATVITILKAAILLKMI